MDVFISGFVQSFLASAAFQIASDAVNDSKMAQLEHNLTQALQAYTDNARMKYGDEWEFIEKGARACIPDNKYTISDDIRDTGASEAELCKQWMTRYNESPLYKQDVQSFCVGWINVLFDTMSQDSECRWMFTRITGVSTYNNTQRIIDNQKAAEEARGLERQEDREYFDKKFGEMNPNPPSPAPAPAVKRVADHTEDYQNLWTENLFLNKRENAFDTVAEVSFHDVYTDYRYSIWNPRTNKEHESKDASILRSSLSEKRGHLVLGDPGIGKSSMISWYLNTIDETRREKVLVYKLSKFALSGIEPDTILAQMGKTLDKLEDYVLFLDGLDECSLAPGERAGLLVCLQESWGSRFSWVVTCRQNYIPKEGLSTLTAIQRITLLPMDVDQIKTFLSKYEAAIKKPINEEKRNAMMSPKHGSIFGIPLILYITAALGGIQVAEDTTVVTIYDRLFENLYNRAITNHSEFRELSKTNPEAAKRLWNQIQTMDRQIALWMLHHDPENAVIPRDDYKSIEASIGGQIKEHRLHDYHSFMRHTEGENKLCYVHRTMYEYFVADGFVALAKEAKDANDAEALSGLIAWYWHITPMSVTIQDYVRDKLKQKENQTLCSLSLWEDAGALLMTRGVKSCPKPSADAVPGCPFPTYPGTLKEDRKQENAAFYSLCRLLDGVRTAAEEASPIYQGAPEETRDALARAVRHCGADRFIVYCPNFDLTGADLTRADLSFAHLDGAHLDGAHLDSAHLDGANLNGANLDDADLTGAHLYGARLSRADLTGAHLTGAHLTQANLNGAYLTSEQAQYLVKYHRFKCAFESIRIVDSNWDTKEYTRSDLFSTFFP